MTGHGIYPLEKLQSAARAYSKKLIAFDALALAREHGTEANAVLLGALAGSGVLPLREEAYREAIRRERRSGRRQPPRASTPGSAVAAGSTGVAGREGRGASEPHSPRTPSRRTAASPAVTASSPGLRSGRRGDGCGVSRGFAGGAAVRRFRGWLTIRIGSMRGRYLEQAATVRAGRESRSLRRLVARHLAVWMTYEDAVRVAQLKTRAGRFERIRRDKGVGKGEIVVTDYLKPDLDEIYGVLPYRLVAPFARWAERRWPHGRPSLGQHVKTTTVSGFVRVWMLTWLRPLRPDLVPRPRGHARMDRWLAAVARCAQWDDALACEIARAAQLVKETTETSAGAMTAHFDRLLEAALRTAEREATGGKFEASEIARRAIPHLGAARPRFGGRGRRARRRDARPILARAARGYAVARWITSRRRSAS